MTLCRCSSLSVKHFLCKFVKSLLTTKSGQLIFCYKIRWAKVPLCFGKHLSQSLVGRDIPWRVIFFLPPPLSDAITLIEADTFLDLGMSPSHYFFSAQQFVLKTSLCLDATTFPFSSVRMHGRFRKQSSSVTISLLNRWQLFLIHVYSLDKAAATYTVNIYNLKIAVTWAEAESDVTLWQNHPNPALPLFDFIA